MNTPLHPCGMQDRGSRRKPARWDDNSKDMRETTSAAYQKAHIRGMLKMPFVMTSPSSKRQYVKVLESRTTSFWWHQLPRNITETDSGFVSHMALYLGRKENLHNNMEKVRLSNYSMTYKYDGGNREFSLDSSFCPSLAIAVKYASPTNTHHLTVGWLTYSSHIRDHSIGCPCLRSVKHTYIIFRPEVTVAQNTFESHQLKKGNQRHWITSWTQLWFIIISILEQYWHFEYQHGLRWQVKTRLLAVCRQS